MEVIGRSGCNACPHPRQASVRLRVEGGSRFRRQLAHIALLFQFAELVLLKGCQSMHQRCTSASQQPALGSGSEDSRRNSTVTLATPCNLPVTVRCALGCIWKQQILQPQPGDQNTCGPCADAQGLSQALRTAKSGAQLPASLPAQRRRLPRCLVRTQAAALDKQKASSCLVFCCSSCVI